MNLDLFAIGWLHLMASLIALLVGAITLVRPKGTFAHRLRGWIYVTALVVTSITALGIYRLGIFFFAHWFAVAALIGVTVAVVAAHFKIPKRMWVHLHLTCMLASYYILIGGGVNEVFMRVNFLRRIAPRLDAPVVGLTHFAVMIIFLMLIANFNVAIAMRSRRPVAAPPGGNLLERC
jgi:uncharacterized membrane protein